MVNGTAERAGDGRLDAAEIEERLLEGPRLFTRAEVASRADVPLDDAKRLWRALGFPSVADDDVAFTEADVAALRRISGLVRSGAVDDDLALSITRAMGHSMARLVDWQTTAFYEHLRDSGELDAKAAQRGAVESSLRHLDEIERLLLFVWRRQLAAVTGRALADVERDAELGICTVGFADLVSYSRLAQRLEERELARLVSDFESRSSDIVVAGGGRVVKTVGDEILFTAATPAQGAAIALALAEAMRAAPDLPDVRVGLATGAVVSRLGDVFGATVNTASRLTAMAQPGSVLVDGTTAKSVAGDEAFALDASAVRAVRGLGLVRMGVLTRRTAPPAVVPAGTDDGTDADPPTGADLPTGPDPGAPLDPGIWDCDRCLRVNPGGRDACVQCGAPRDEGRSPGT
jgi:adenylate cyclase